MLVLAETVNYVGLFVLAAILGGVGGLVYELLQTRAGGPGLVEWPSKGSGPYRDWGVFANIIVGAVAAVAALWVFPPETSTVISEQSGEATTTIRYSLIDVVGLSLIIGSAGSSFLSSLQARALARVKEQQAAATQEVAAGQIASLEKKIDAGAPKTRSPPSSSRPRLPSHPWDRASLTSSRPRSQSGRSGTDGPWSRPRSTARVTASDPNRSFTASSVESSETRRAPWNGSASWMAPSSARFVSDTPTSVAP